MVSKIIFTLLILCCANNVFASLILIPKKRNTDPILPFFSVPLFSESERLFLEKQNRTALSLARVYPNLNQVNEQKILALLNEKYKNAFEIEKSSDASLQEDTLSSLQWALKNDGATQRISIDHYTSGQVQGRNGQDVQVTESKNGKTTLVAIIDTGVDHQHPDLKGSLFSKGYNVLTQNDDTQDTHGHGTHLSGIIAAQKNDIGVSGVSNNLKILPIKVIQSGPNAPIRPQSLGGPSAGTALTENVAKGILYAVQNGAQVINMSLAWPANIRSVLVESMIALAEEKNVLVVASAGNDSTNAPVFPCAYATVVCVASHGPDGAYSHFSNFGSMVDLAAPGTAIISTWPMNKAPTTFAGGIGYEYRNGTSMAAPYVAGALGELIAQGFSPQEARARILLGTRPTESQSLFVSPSIQNFSSIAQKDTKWARFGNLDMKKALQVVPQPLILPVKNSKSVLWDGISKEIPIQITLKNEWIDAKNISVEVNNKVFYLDQLLAQKTTTLTYSLKINSETESLVHLNLKVMNKEYKIPVSIIREIRSDNFPEGSKVTRIEGLNIDSETEMRSVVSSDGLLRSDFALLKDIGKNVKVTLIQNGSLQDTTTIENHTSDQLLNVYRVAHGKIILIFTDQNSNNTRPSFFVYFFDPHLDSFKQITIGTETTILSEDFQWMDMNGENSLAWVSIGFTPKPDLPAYDPWNPDAKDSKAARIYFIKDGELRTLKLKDTQLPLELLPKRAEDILSNTVRVLIAEGESYSVEYKIISLRDGEIKSTEVLPLDHYRMLIGNKNIVPVQSLIRPNLTGLFAATGPSTQGGLRISGFGDLKFDEPLNRSTPLESLIVASGVFTDTEKAYFFVQSHYDLKFYAQGRDEVYSTSLNRYSYIPSMISSRSFFQTTQRGKNSKFNPAIYIPATLLTDFSSEVIYADLADSGTLKRPARLKLKLTDSNCIALGNLIPATETTPAYQTYFCKDQQILVPIE